MKVSIIGAGNVAWHMAKALEQVGMDIIEIYARNRSKAKQITKELYDTDVTDSLDFSKTDANIYIIAVSDNAIGEIASNIILPPKSILVHTSGSISISVLENASIQNPDCQLGVFYPLMTFSKAKKITFKTIPICIEANNKESFKTIFQLASMMSNEVYEVSSHDRQVLHLAAVFACNFSNHLFALSKEILNEEKLNFDLLKPLIQETFDKGFAAAHPAEVQTGPAVRRDSKTIEAHRALIKDDQDLLRVYDTMTNSIQDWHTDS